MSDELKACSTPWCHNPVAHFIGTYHSINKCYVKDVSVICLGCGIKLNKTFASEAEAIAAWNTRPIEDELRQRVKELEAQVETLETELKDFREKAEDEYWMQGSEDL